MKYLLPFLLLACSALGQSFYDGTNPVATVSYVNVSTNGHVTSAVTNGLAPVAYVTAATNGLVTAAITNAVAQRTELTASTNGLPRFYRAGTIAVTAGTLTYSPSFTSSMPTTNYSISLVPSAAANLSVTSKTTSGFSLGVALGINGTVDYVCWLHN